MALPITRDLGLNGAGERAGGESLRELALPSQGRGRRARATPCAPDFDVTGGGPTPFDRSDLGDQRIKLTLPPFATLGTVRDRHRPPGILASFNQTTQ